MLICCSCVGDGIPTAAMDTALSFAAMGMPPTVLLELESHHDSDANSGTSLDLIKEQTKQLAEFGIENLFACCGPETSPLEESAGNHIKELDVISQMDSILMHERADAILSF